MNYMKKTLVALFLATSILAACEPVTPAPTATATEMPALATLPTITPVPSMGPLLPSNGPDKEIASYRLRTWTEDDYTRIVESLDDLVGENDGQISSLSLPDYRVAFQLEHLLKFPDSSSRKKIQWDVLSNKPGTMAIPGTQVTGDLMSSLISDLLAQNVRPADISSEIEKQGLEVMDTVTVQNMIGNGEDGLVLLIGMHGVESLVGVFAIVREGDKLQVHKIRDWEVSEAPAMGVYFEIYDAGDTNGNGLPEIVVQVQTGGSGTPQIWKESIDHIEWVPQNKTFQSESFPVFWQTCEEMGVGPCEGDWEFSQLDSQRVLTTKSYWATRKECPRLTIQRVSVWDGKEYASGNPEIVPPEDDLSPECRLAWAETAIWLPESDWSDLAEPGWTNDLAISIVEKSLDDWPAGADEIWGPASRDYFKLKLGIWYELRNEGGKASILLQQVKNKASQAEYDFISRLASFYLQSRAGKGKVQACLELENAYFEELRAAIPEPSPYNNDQAMIQALGIVQGKESLCDVYDMLSAELKAARLTSAASLMQWLDKTELTVYQQLPIDLNDDELEDYAILLDTTDSETPDVWLFLSTPNGYQASYLTDLWPEDGQSRLNIQPITTGDGALVHLIMVDGDLILIRVASHLRITNLVEEYGVQSFEIGEMPARVSLHINSPYNGRKDTLYLWDASAQNFVKQTDSFINAQAESERLIYTEEDYQRAISYLNEFLRSASPEPKFPYLCGENIPGGCKYLPEWYVPYFRYLRGLAYEQLGQVDQAKQDYYQLWQDFPKNVFGMAASLKLEPVSP